jgi:hypothetical protein
MEPVPLVRLNCHVGMRALDLSVPRFHLVSILGSACPTERWPPSTFWEWKPLMIPLSAFATQTCASWPCLVWLSQYRCCIVHIAIVSFPLFVRVVCFCAGSDPEGSKKENDGGYSAKYMGLH